MKKIILCALIVLAIDHSQAQLSQYKPATGKKSNDHSKNSKSRINKPGNETYPASAYKLENSSTHYAYGSSPNYNIYTIHDPVLQVMNLRANGYDVKMGKSGIMGEGKRTYGFADGHLIFYSSGATSSGTITGSGAVGPGSSPGSIGSNPIIPGVNGKSPYAGPSSWGTAVTGRGITLKDSAVGHPDKKKN